MAVYFGAIQIRRVRHTLAAALTAADCRCGGDYLCNCRLFTLSLL